MSRDPGDEPPLPSAMWDLLRRDEPEPRAVADAYRRFLGRSPAVPSPLSLLRWLALGFVAGWGVAFAATGDPLFGAGLRRAGAPATSASATATPRHVTHAPAPLASSAPAPSEPLAPAASNSSAHAVASAPRAVAEETPGTSPEWRRASAALRVHDYPAAESALRELERNGSAGDRDAASLALAQVLLARGRSVEARARLERLSARAGAPLVRNKAAALLAQLSSPSERSFSPPAVPE